MTVPNALYLDCPDCGEHTVHEVLKGKIGRKQETMEATVKCQECGRVYTTVVREPEPIKVPIIISEQGKSRKTEIELESGEELGLENELMLGDEHLIVTAIEVGEKRVSIAKVEDIKTIWAKRFDKIIVKISVNKHTKTIPTQVDALPDEEFFIGDLMTVGKDSVVIHTIKSRDGMVRRGSVAARDIVRIYTKAVRTTSIV